MKQGSSNDVFGKHLSVEEELLLQQVLEEAQGVSSEEQSGSPPMLVESTRESGYSGTLENKGNVVGKGMVPVRPSIDDTLHNLFMVDLASLPSPGAHNTSTPVLGSPSPLDKAVLPPVRRVLPPSAPPHSDELGGGKSIREARRALLPVMFKAWGQLGAKLMVQTSDLERATVLKVSYSACLQRLFDMCQCLDGDTNAFWEEARATLFGGSHTTVKVYKDKTVRFGEFVSEDSLFALHVDMLTLAQLGVSLIGLPPNALEQVIAGWPSGDSQSSASFSKGQQSLESLFSSKVVAGKQVVGRLLLRDTQPKDVSVCVQLVGGPSKWEYPIVCESFVKQFQLARFVSSKGVIRLEGVWSVAPEAGGPCTGALFAEEFTVLPPEVYAELGVESKLWLPVIWVEKFGFSGDVVSRSLPVEPSPVQVASFPQSGDREILFPKLVRGSVSCETTYDVYEQKMRDVLGFTRAALNMYVVTVGSAKLNETPSRSELSGRGKPGEGPMWKGVQAGDQDVVAMELVKHLRLVTTHALGAYMYCPSRANGEVPAFRQHHVAECFLRSFPPESAVGARLLALREGGVAGPLNQPGVSFRGSLVCTEEGAFLNLLLAQVLLVLLPDDTRGDAALAFRRGVRKSGEQPMFFLERMRVLGTLAGETSSILRRSLLDRLTGWEALSPANASLSSAFMELVIKRLDHYGLTMEVGGFVSDSPLFRGDSPEIRVTILQQAWEHLLAKGMATEVKSTGLAGVKSVSAGGQSSTRRCFRCNSTDHLKRECPNKPVNGGTATAPQSGTVVGAGGSSLQRKQLASTTCSRCGAKGHEAKRCSATEDQARASSPQSLGWSSYQCACCKLSLSSTPMVNHLTWWCARNNSCRNPVADQLGTASGGGAQVQGAPGVDVAALGAALQEMQAAMAMLLTKQAAAEQQPAVGASGKKMLRLPPGPQRPPAPGAGQFAVLQEAFESQDLQDD